MKKFPLQGSERHPMNGARLIGPSNPLERLEVTILIRPSQTAALQERVARLTRGDYSLAPLTRSEFAAKHGASQSDIETVKHFAEMHLLTVVGASAARRTIILSGTVAAFNAAFDINLSQYEHSEGTYRGRQGPLSLPTELTNIVQAVLGLDNRPQARMHLRRRNATPSDNQSATPTSYTPTQVANHYNFPPGTGHGQTIGIIELAGGTRPADLTTYFNSIGTTPPKLISVSVDHGKNHATGNANGPDGEVMLDIEVAGAIAPGASLAIYFAPNTDSGFLNAITTAIHDTTNNPSVISISWGGPESSWTRQALTAFDQAFQDAAALGITICVAAGDNGSSDGTTTNAVDFPAASPHVLACGGTSLQTTGNSISRETVWNNGAQGGATGGGISTTFPAPSWQTGLSAPLTAGGSTTLSFRGVPDIAGNADPQTGYQVRVDGQNTVIGGTSAVAPLWAGLIARINATRTTPIGFINPILYQNPSALTDITLGNNGTYAAALGWDACTGLGSPNGEALATLLANNSDTTNANTKNRVFLTHRNETPMNDEAFLLHGNNKPAQPGGKLGDHAFLLHGNVKKAGETKLKDEAFLLHGNTKIAQPSGMGRHLND